MHPTTAILCDKLGPDGRFSTLLAAPVLSATTTATTAAIERKHPDGEVSYSVPTTVGNIVTVQFTCKQCKTLQITLVVPLNHSIEKWDQFGEVDVC